MYTSSNLRGRGSCRRPSRGQVPSVSAANHPPATNCPIPRGFAVQDGPSSVGLALWPKAVSQSGRPSSSAGLAIWPTLISRSCKSTSSTFFAGRLKIVGAASRSSSSSSSHSHNLSCFFSLCPSQEHTRTPHQGEGWLCIFLLVRTPWLHCFPASHGYAVSHSTLASCHATASHRA
jgi:hypothetical protein